jgi:hypothetical protein
MRYHKAASRLPEDLVAEIGRRLALRKQLGPSRLLHSIRAICRELHVDRETVRAIERGQYSSESKQFARCPLCGHRVLLPCLICATRSIPAAAAA